jgi:GNAT superfamily N-acetyltransferase
MWPEKPLSYVAIANDNTARHYGLFVDGKLTSIISIFIENNQAQFRKFATLVKFQGLGYGTVLLNNIIYLLQKEGVSKLWCNARVEKTNYYERFNLKTTESTYEKGGIAFVIMERNFDNNQENKK